MRFGQDETPRMTPSEVFVQRLRETRKARGMTQTELAERANDWGIPMSKPALQRIEGGTRSVSLDEALGLAACLWAVPALLLTPPEGAELAVAPSKMALLDGAEIRNWLATGDPILARHATPSSENRAAIDARFEQRMTAYARALVDAIRAKDEAGRTVAFEAMKSAVDEHRADVAVLEEADRG